MKKYILFGTGIYGIKALKFIGADAVECFCDNNAALHGKSVEGKIVISPSQLKERVKEYSQSASLLAHNKVLSSSTLLNKAKEMGDELVVVVTTIKPLFLKEIAIQLTRDNIPFVLAEEVCNEIIKNEMSEYNSLLKERETFMAKDDKYFYPVYADRFADAGAIDSYFWQDLWAAEKILSDSPQMHYDIGSRIDGFIAHLSAAGQRVNLIDIRPLDTKIPGVSFTCADATNLEGIEDGSIKSLSALCSLEHFGLGRYGDDINPEACFKCFDAISRKLALGGKLYISVPIGKEHIEFNAHRVYAAQTIVDAFSKLKLIEFSSCYHSQIERDIDIHKYDNWVEKGGFRFGLFRFEK